jgi:predicted  nucleic acid-binding Zn-ribbon protein
MIMLQKVMFKIKGLEDERNSTPEKIADLKNETLAAEKEFHEVSSEHDELGKQKKDLEYELEDEKEKIERSKARLMTIKTNREYFAMLKEIDMVKRMNRQREEELLELMVRYDEVEAKYNIAKERYEALKNEFDKKMEAIKKHMKSFDSDIAKLEREKEEIAKKLDINKTRRFELVFKRRNGVAVVPAKDYICTGCNMNIPPQLYNLIQKEDRLYECPNCSRILYCENDKEKEAFEG